LSGGRRQFKPVSSQKKPAHKILVGVRGGGRVWALDHPAKYAYTSNIEFSNSLYLSRLGMDQVSEINSIRPEKTIWYNVCKKITPNIYASGR
jgi:hypothetical protein